AFPDRGPREPAAGACGVAAQRDQSQQGEGVDDLTFPDPEDRSVGTEPAGAAEIRKVLVVDTDPGVRWALEKGLARSGYRVWAVSSVSEALRLLRETSLDGIVLELQPEAGLTAEVLSMFTETPEAPQVICVSI